MKLILIRHGETIENVKGIIQGHLPGKLTKKGIEQAKKLALKLKDEKIDYIYSSDLARASDTTKEIIKFHPNTPIEFTNDLRERNSGEYQGKNKKEIKWAKEGDFKNYIEPKKGETRTEICSRAKGFYDHIIKKHKEKNILLVGHGGINTALTSVIMGKSFVDVLKMGEMKNTCIIIFEINKDKNHKIRLFNCTKHLD
jgi:probable phosphoglycerate mutase